ncbi:hypothetical protein C1I92_20545 [Jiangella anatolica]|uniref:Uncharacterized protein n=1 Tax=Jiangella anatolica TaxID=2670374 RepID=A0A2W2B8T3_9ACTN|nr:hypothetical protein C1I92_20545 [Jiangella anatolica]
MALSPSDTIRCVTPSAVARTSRESGAAADASWNGWSGGVGQQPVADQPVVQHTERVAERGV